MRTKTQSFVIGVTNPLDLTFHSQYQQDQFLEQQVFNGFKNGVFVDVGAHDGVSLNNTLFFERAHGWSGINVEPLPDIYRQLRYNRPRCINLNCAISSTNGTAEFVSAEMLSGLVQHSDPRHDTRRQQEMGSTMVIQVQTRRLEDVLDEYGVRRVHYLSIDVEGAEWEVIQSIRFDKVFIDVIGFECNYPDTATPILQYLEGKGYAELGRTESDIFMIHKNSQFYRR